LSLHRITQTVQDQEQEFGVPRPRLG